MADITLVQTISSLYTSMYGELQSFCFEQSPTLLIWDAENILLRLAGAILQRPSPDPASACGGFAVYKARRRPQCGDGTGCPCCRYKYELAQRDKRVADGELIEYVGEAEIEQFREFAHQFIAQECKRVALVEEVMTTHMALLLKTIKSGMPVSAFDCSVDEESLLSDVTELIERYAVSLMKRGPAQLRTRVVALAKRHVQLYRTQVKRDLTMVEKKLRLGEVIQTGEVLSNEERAWMAAEAAGEAA